MRSPLVAAVVGLLIVAACSDRPMVARPSAIVSVVSVVPVAEMTPVEGGVVVSSRVPTMTGLMRARALWAKAAPANYRYESITIDCECALAGSLSVAVNAAKVLQLARRDRPAAAYYELDAGFGYTVERLFALVEESQDTGVLNRVELDSAGGYPTAIDAGRGRTDAHIMFTMTSFVPAN